MTDFYEECEVGLKSLILAQLPDYFPHAHNVSNDDAVIAKGGDHFLIPRPGKFPYTKGSEMEEGTYHWEIQGDLYVRYKNYKTSWDAFKAVRSALINLVHQYPNLDDTPGVLDVTLASSERPGYMKFNPNSTKINFIIQTLAFTVVQWVTFGGGEI